MDQAFDAIAEPAAGAAPLEAMSACNERLLRHCATLRRLVLYLGECCCDAQAHAAIERLLHFFDTVLPRHHSDEQDELFPALIESMAGSDAVCLHDVTGGLVQDHRAVQRHWLRLRPAIKDVLGGRSQALPAHEVEALVERCLACVTREDGELLPMAARLLSDDQLQAIAAAMRERRSPP
jgi:hemerythrin-like domain-containing protein